MNHRNPPMLAQAATSPLLRNALAAAKTEGPNAGQLARLGARLPLGGFPPVTPAELPANGGGVGAGVVSSVSGSVSGAAIVGAALGALVSAFAILPSPPPQGPAPVEVSARLTTAPAVPSTLRGLARNAPASEPAPEVRPQLGIPSESARRQPPRRLLPTGPLAAESASVEQAVAHGAEPATPEAIEGPSPVVETEVQMLKRAQDALAANPGEALAITRAHAGRYAGGTLAQEREVVAIQALLRLGRDAEARSRAASFVEAYPRSAHQHRVEALVGTR